MCSTSSTPATFSGAVANPVTAGPVGTGTLAIASGTYLTATTAATINNNFVLGGTDLTSEGEKARDELAAHMDDLEIQAARFEEKGEARRQRKMQKL